MEITPAWWKQNSVPSWRKQMMHLLKFQKKYQMEKASNRVIESEW